MSKSEAEPRYRLFDSDGLPWASRIGWGWLCLITLITGFTFAVALGIYLGIWTKGKGRSVLPLCLYLAIAFIAILAIAAAYAHLRLATDALDLVGFALWFAAAFVLRYEVIRYYSQREGTVFRIGPWLTALFSVWYICGSLRADYPLDETGKAPAGVLKLSVQARPGGERYDRVV